MKFIASIEFREWLVSQGSRSVRWDNRSSLASQSYKS